MATIVVIAGDAADLRTAIQTTAATGDVVQVPSGTYSITTAITITKGITIEGEGDGATIISTGANAVNAFAIDPTAANISRLIIKNLKFSSSANGLAGIKTTVASGKSILALEIERCNSVSYTTGYDIGGTGMTTEAALIGCIATTCTNGGIKLTNVTQANLTRCKVTGCNTSNGVATTDSAVFLSACNGFVILGLKVDTMSTTAGATKTGLCVANCLGGVIDGLSVVQTAFQSESIALSLITPTCRGITVNSGNHSYITTPISIASGCEQPFTRAAGFFRAAP